MKEVTPERRRVGLHPNPVTEFCLHSAFKKRTSPVHIPRRNILLTFSGLHKKQPEKGETSEVGLS